LLKLKRVEIQGFKSFYDRTEMKFPGNGIAAVVGPNGCGKSNLSDAISWVLGEQSAKSLRGTRMEDVIFAGTRDRKALSMASVTLTMVPDENSALPIHLGVSEPDATQTAAHPEEKTPPAAVPHLNGVERVNGIEHLHHQHDNDHDGDDHRNGNHSNGHHANGTNGIPKPEVIHRAEQRGEITITRRLFRSGESEYLINGKQARLRDIQDLFLGTGLGPESYAIIEQGRIGQILSNRPQDRRSVIEEAAGITKFKTRKRLAEARLESAKQNLARVFDILEEVSRQVNSLKRQAAKTRRYQELRTEAIGYLRQILVARFQTLERDSARLVIEINLASNELQSAQASIAELEQQQAVTTAQSYETEQQLTEVRRKLADLQLEAERARGKIEYQSKQVHQIEIRLQAGAQEAESLRRDHETRASELTEQTAALGEIEQQHEASKNLLNAKTQERQAAQRLLAEQERALETARQSVLKLLHESSTLKNRIAQASAQLASLDRDTTRARSEEQQAVSDSERLQKTRAEISERLQARQTELISVADQRREVEQQLNECRSGLSAHRQAVERLRTEYSRIKARRDSLEEVIQHRSFSTETVQRLFTAVEHNRAQGWKPTGVLADFLEVDSQVERAAEEFLHEELEYVVVQNQADGECGIELIRGEIGGRATFLIETLSGGASTDIPEPAGLAALDSNRLSKLTDSLRFTNGISHLPLALLPRIANCYVTADAELAKELAPQFPHCWFLTSDGLTYQGQAVSGGKKSTAGPLALKRELREVSALEQTREAELNTAQTALSALERTIQELSHQSEALRSQEQTQEKTVLGLDHESRKFAEEFQRAQTRLSNARLELDHITRERARLEESDTSDRTSLEQSEALRTQQEQALESAREELAEAQRAGAVLAEEHATLRAALASLEEQRKSISAHQARLEYQLRELANRHANLARESETLNGERIEFLSNNQELELRREELAGAIRDGEAFANQLAEREAGFRSALSALEEQLKDRRAHAQANQERRSGYQVDLARAESDLKHLEETCQKELETTLAELAKGVEEMPDEETLAHLDAKYAEVQRKVESLGPVNPQALEEFEEAGQRQDFLSAQRQDLLDSIRDTEKAIHEIDGESQKRFLEAFRVINVNFREMFQTLFGGGTGEMRLTDEANASESGIEIVASPPGKKLQSVLLLSGGEKSLTAMALLMAIFQYTPSPFCVLDEVDAPLDESNIERLTRLIREMAGQTQFIVITHSKRTMEAAQSLYGVTMQEPGVSKLVSVKFTSGEEKVQAASAGSSRETQFEPALV
jgi:chromosome segregation protein